MRWWLCVGLPFIIAGCVAQTAAPVPAAPLGMEQLAPATIYDTPAPPKRHLSPDKQRVLDRLDKIDQELNELEAKIPRQ